MTPAQRMAWESYWPLYGLELKTEEILDLDKIFGRHAEKILEIGFGDGRSLLQMAKNAPEKDFLGIEVYRQGVGNLMKMIAEEGLTNIRIVCQDALEVLEHHIPDNSLARIQIFFADPWPKTRHHKRRLIQSQFITLVAKKLRLAGVLHLATDWEEYAQHMMQVLTQHKNFQNSAGTGQFSARPDFRPLTKYEQRGLRLGHISRDLIFKHIAD
jgi:tRNA (guanine-N7-)-methyltransferase